MWFAIPNGPCAFVVVFHRIASVHGGFLSLDYPGRICWARDGEVLGPFFLPFAHSFPSPSIVPLRHLVAFPHQLSLERGLGWRFTLFCGDFHSTDVRVTCLSNHVKSRIQRFMACGVLIGKDSHVVGDGGFVVGRCVMFSCPTEI